MRRRAALMLPLLLAAPRLAQAANPLTVFAAASLTDVMKDIDALWQKQGNPPLRLSFAASSTLARQIEAGAPANLFASADEQWADWLQQRNLIVPETRRDLLSNSLVMVVPHDQAKTIDIGPKLDLAALLGANGKIATGDPAHVPVGIYAEQALKKLGLWQVAEPRLARADSVRSALLLVERGEAPLGIVYATDAAVSETVVIAGTFPPDSHDPVTYPFALVRSGDTPEARLLLQFLAGAQARQAFVRRGFGVKS